MALCANFYLDVMHYFLLCTNLCFIDKAIFYIYIFWHPSDVRCKIGDKDCVMVKTFSFIFKSFARPSNQLQLNPYFIF